MLIAFVLSALLLIVACCASVFPASGIMLSVLNADCLCVECRSADCGMPCVCLSASVIMASVIMASVILASVILASVILASVILASVTMMNVVAPMIEFPIESIVRHPLQQKLDIRSLETIQKNS